jgi:signal transduction histidine kinase
MTFDKNKSVDIAVVEKMRHSLNTIGELLRLTRASEHPDLDSCTSLGAEAKRIVGDLNNESTITSKGIKLSFTPPAAETYVGIAPVTLFRLIENLVRNAAEAINRPDGEIHVEVCDFGNHPTVTVRDNGPGIPDHLKGRIFEFAFSTKSDRGTGLGLGIVEKICRDIQARVTVESKPGEGATFTIAFLPITQHLYGETNDKAIHSHC